MIGNIVVLSGSPGKELETLSRQQGLAQLGARMVFADGREFRYVKAGAVALAPGDLQQGPAFIANHIGLTPTAAAAGALIVTVTLGATAATADQYKDGYLMINQGTGRMGLYQIATHPAAASAGTLAVTMYEAVKVAIPATAASADLVPNRYNGVIVQPTTPTAEPVGVAVVAIPISNFGWVQTKGLAAVNTQGTVVVGNVVIPSTTTAGAVTPNAAATFVGIPLGAVAKVNATTLASLVNLFGIN